MHVLSEPKLESFWGKYSGAKTSLLAWYKAAERCSAQNFNELIQTFTSADYIPPGFTVIDICKNKYRIVVAIHYDRQKMYIRHVFTHREYDGWTQENRKK
jgi:mRNA interferase HigB